jgi:hypothetical protein
MPLAATGISPGREGPTAAWRSDVGVEGGQIAVVDADQPAAGGAGHGIVFGGVDLHQGVHPKGAAQVHQGLELPGR